MRPPAGSKPASLCTARGGVSGRRERKPQRQSWPGVWATIGNRTNHQAMSTRLIISHVLAQITKGGSANKDRGRLFHLFGRSYGSYSAFARVRYRAKPDADGVTFSFQIGKNKWYKAFERASRHQNPHHEVWILHNAKTYYFVPSSALAELGLRPGSYRHPEYDPGHRLVHINTQTHQCSCAGRQEDFSPYYQATLQERYWSPKVRALLKSLGN